MDIEKCMLSDEVKTFNKITDLNWAWMYEVRPEVW